MSSKSVRNGIVALIILAIGSWLLIKLGKSFIPRDSPLDFSSIFTAFESLLNIFLIAIVIIIIILIPVWIAKKREERKQSIAEGKLDLLYGF